MDPAELERIGEHIAKMQLDPTTPQDVEDLADYAARLYGQIAALTARLQAAEKMYENSQRTVAEMTGAYEAMESERDDAVSRLQAAEAERETWKDQAKGRLLSDAALYNEVVAERDDARRRLRAMEEWAQRAIARLRGYELEVQAREGIVSGRLYGVILDGERLLSNPVPPPEPTR